MDNDSIFGTGSVGGVTIAGSKSWMRNNPEIDYPDNHEEMTDDDLYEAIKLTTPEQTEEEV